MTFRRRDPISGPEPESDVFSVTRTIRDGVTVFHVAHYPTREAKEPCCQVEIIQRPEESEMQALARASVECDVKHGG